MATEMGILYFCTCRKNRVSVSTNIPRKILLFVGLATIAVTFLRHPTMLSSRVIGKQRAITTFAKAFSMQHHSMKSRTLTRTLKSNNYGEYRRTASHLLVASLPKRPGSRSSVLSKHTSILFSTARSSDTASSDTATSQTAAKKGNGKKNGGAAQQMNTTGGLRRLPVVKGPKELSDRASKVAGWTKADEKVKNIRNRARKHGTETINTLMQQLCIPLRDIVDGYRRELRRLHPFEATVADLTVRARIKKDGLTLEVLLEEIHEARKMILESGKEWIYKCKHAETAKEANLAKEEGFKALLDLFDTFAFQPVEGMVDLQRSLRSAPAVALDAPAVVLVCRRVISIIKARCHPNA